ncbi:SDR family NAD(P)-dependent oxidoreductase [Thalassotalea mangrovi]|uniref:SDR family NAD(P)-dependent oxidoreductase n=1 Tax=Thalassotalea mangrovi TaxID=2572245 RepID=A0A4U1B549_9GAMM|nr:SDR family NAD(P)-dependent oxidoreductase [Thalassotalea mangrovi]TKB45560.1 SDR family NAD(P)-dependent oxidoreductase [Thalassotalea mangrovi]
MKRALVTGANRGIGLEIAKGLATKGYQVIIGARDISLGEKAAKEIGAEAIALDVGDENSIKRAVAMLGSVDVLVNNAGILGEGHVLDEINEFDSSMAVMVRGPFLLMHLLVPAMIQQNYGRVVNISSGWGAFAAGLEGPGAYGVAKASLNALTVCAARDLPDNVKINAMCPGWVRTRMGGKEADRSVAEGADTGIWLATLPDDGPSGGFFRDRTEISW